MLLKYHLRLSLLYPFQIKLDLNLLIIKIEVYIGPAIINLLDVKIVRVKSNTTYEYFLLRSFYSNRVSWEQLHVSAFY